MGKEVHLIVDLDDSLGYANGCVGVSVKVDGVDYWISYKWEASKSDDVTVSLDADNVYNVTFNNGSGTVKDADQIAKIAEAAQTQCVIVNEAFAIQVIEPEKEIADPGMVGKR